MKTNHLLSALLVLATLAGCAKEMVENPGAAPAALGTQTFTATVETPVPAASTKSFDGTIKAFQFKVDDEIAISDGTTTSVFTATEVADGNVTFTIKADETPLATEGVTYKAYYPASIAPGKSGVEGQTGMYMMQQQINSNGETSADKTINYTESFYEANPMYAESTTSELKFTNLCGLICITLTQGTSCNYAINQIILQSDSKALYGPCEIVDGALCMTSSESDFNRIATKNTNAKYVTSNDTYYLAVPAGTYNDVEFIPYTNRSEYRRYPIKAGRQMVIERNKVYTLSLCLEDLAIDLSESGTANTYIATPGASTTYRFLATRGCSSTPLEGVSSAELIWRTQTSTTTTLADKVVTDAVSYKDGYVYFTTSNNQGDALIGAYDAAGDLIWTWFIWSPSVKAADVTLPCGKVILDRNLGALVSDVKVSGANYSSQLAVGLIYQWGNPTPFPGRGNNGASRSALVGKNGATLTSSLSTTAPVSVKDALAGYPNTFVGTADGAVWTDDENVTWDGAEKTIYDPCPYGYRVQDNTMWGETPNASQFVMSYEKVNSSTSQMMGYYYHPGDANLTLYATNGVIIFSSSKYTYTGAVSQHSSWYRNVSGSTTGYYSITGKTTLEGVALGTSPVRSCEARGVRCEKIQ